MELEKIKYYLQTYLDDVIDFSDRILGVTPENGDENNAFEDYL